MEKLNNSIAQQNNFFFKGLIIFFLGTISYSVSDFITNGNSNSNNTIIGLIGLTSILIALIVTLIYLILGFLELKTNINKKKEELINKKVTHIKTFEENKTQVSKKKI